MEPSTVGFKYKSADLHRKSPKIFAMSMIVSVIFTAVIINLTFTYKSLDIKRTERAPFVINMEKIPETNRAVQQSAPSKPFLDSGTPIEIDDDIMPDEITIEEARIDFEPAAESSMITPGAETGETGSSNFSVTEEIPKKLNNIVPIYPEIAERAGLEGAVTLQVLVGVTGSIDSIVVLDGPKIFIDNAIDAAKRTRFIPAKFNGEPVASWVYMPFRFMLDE